jgi:inhibitor of KinA sporulation pathway (predicted exonuclease)
MVHPLTLLVWDIEANCHDLNCEKDQPIEIIEIPICPLSIVKHHFSHKPFHAYVKPCVPLTKACTVLTGITQTHVGCADDLNTVVNRLDSWMKQHGFSLDNCTLNESLFACCGNYDPKALISEANRLNINLPQYFYQPFMNIKVIFSDYLDSINLAPTQQFRRHNNEPYPNLCMTKMLNILGLPLIGKHHSGIDDANNLTRIAIHLLEKGMCFRATGIVDHNGMFHTLPS